MWTRILKFIFRIYLFLGLVFSAFMGFILSRIWNNKILGYSAALIMIIVIIIQSVIIMLFLKAVRHLEDINEDQKKVIQQNVKIINSNAIRTLAEKK